MTELSDAERTGITTELARFTGIAVERIDRTSLVITPRQFRTDLLRDRGQTLPLFDLRRTSPVEFEPRDVAAFERYLRRELRYRTSLAYAGLRDAEGPERADATLSVNERWDYFAAGTPAAVRDAAIAEATRVGGGPPGVSEPWLRDAHRLNPALRVLVATGRFDAAQCLVIAETARRLESPLRDAYSTRCYEGGHMMYLDADARAALARNLTALIGALPR